MASVFYPKAKELFLQAGLNLSSLTLKAVLIDTGAYTYSSAHDFLNDVPSGARFGTSAALGSKTFTNGVFDAADTTITVSTGGTSVEAIIIFNDTGVESTSNLIAYIDTFSAGMPRTPVTSDVLTIAWDNGANKIASL